MLLVIIVPLIFLTITTSIGKISSGKAKELSELPVSQEIKTGLMGGGGLFSDIFYLSHNYERANWDRVEYYAERCKIDSGALNMVYFNSLRFLDQFSEIK